MPKRALDLLVMFAQRPRMYVGPLTFATVRSYLLGLRQGCALAGSDYAGEDYVASAEERGWDPSGNIGILRAFQQANLSDEEMARELIAVEIGAYRNAMTRQERQQ